VRVDLTVFSRRQVFLLARPALARLRLAVVAPHNPLEVLVVDFSFRLQLASLAVAGIDPNLPRMPE